MITYMIEELMLFAICALGIAWFFIEATKWIKKYNLKEKNKFRQERDQDHIDRLLGRDQDSPITMKDKITVVARQFFRDGQSDPNYPHAYFSQQEDEILREWKDGNISEEFIEKVYSMAIDPVKKNLMTTMVLDLKDAEDQTYIKLVALAREFYSCKSPEALRDVLVKCVPVVEEFKNEGITWDELVILVETDGGHGAKQDFSDDPYMEGIKKIWEGKIP